RRLEPGFSVSLPATGGIHSRSDEALRLGELLPVLGALRFPSAWSRFGVFRRGEAWLHHGLCRRAGHHRVATYRYRALLQLGYRVWPAIWLGAFLANVTANEPVVTAGGLASATPWRRSPGCGCYAGW